MKACLVHAGVVLNSLMKKLPIYISNQSPTCTAQNTVTGCLPLGHPILIYKLSNLNKILKFQHELLLIFPFRNEIQVNIATPLGKVFHLIRSIFSERRIGIRKYHIVSNPILFNSQACYSPVN